MPANSPEAPLRVLVIEDDLLFQQIIARYLHQSLRGPVDAVISGDLASGLGELADSSFDAVLLDLTLPDSEGLDTLLRLQERAPEVPVIVLTGLDDDEVAAEAVRRGAQDFLVKSELSSASILVRSIRYALERHRTESALRESERRFRAVVEDQTEMVCRFQPDGALSFANPAFCRRMGQTQDELLGRSFFALTGVDRFESFEGAAPSRSREQQMTSGEGAAVWVQWTDRALYDEKGRLVVFQSVGRDITEQKKLEEQLYQSQKTETLGRLAGGVAHDFNNLLTVIIGCCEMLDLERRRAGLSSHPQIEEISKAAERATALTRQLLAVSRRHVAQSAVLDLNRIVCQTEEMFRRLLSEQVDLEVRLAPRLLAIKADRAQIEQILVNLVVNAGDAMPHGGTLTLETALVDEGGEPFAELHVGDTGVGIDPETREKIFEPFFTTKEVGRGTGLGLSIVDSLVKQNSGLVLLESAPQCGSSFRVRLPITYEEIPSERPAVASGLAETPCRSGSILLVEDEALVRDVVISLLEPQGFDVVGAESAEDALDLLAEHGGRGFDVLLTDVVLPDKNGFQLAETVRDRFPGMRILFMSGYTDAAHGDDRWFAGGSRFLQKPFSADELLGKLDEVLETGS